MNDLPQVGHRLDDALHRFTPLETPYHGCQFRSRTEARWAVFFDSLSIPWEYEKEGYDLDGVWYLPDFWLPRQRCWFEVKGELYTDEEAAKAAGLARHTGRPVFIAWGEVAPSVREYAGIHTWDEAGVRNDGQVWAATSAGYQLKFMGWHDIRRGTVPRSAWDTDRLRRGYRTARQARFDSAA